MGHKRWLFDRDFGCVTARRLLLDRVWADDEVWIAKLIVDILCHRRTFGHICYLTGINCDPEVVADGRDESSFRS